MLAVIVSGLWFPQQLFAQATNSSLGAVLHLKKNKYNNYFNTGVDFNTLLNSGQANQASFEFWIKAQSDNNAWVLTDLLGDQESFSMRVENNHQLKLHLKGAEKNIDLNGQIGKNTWHHIALVANNGTTTLYVNGRTRGVFSDLDFNTTLGRQLYFYKARETELFITEVRAWNQARTKQDILRYWAKVIDSNKADELAQHTAKGLDVLLNTSDMTSPDRGVMGWTNAIKESAVKEGMGHAYVDGPPLMQVRTDAGHPILDLEEIFVTASKGEFSDKVQIKWNHIAKATRYTVSRRPQAEVTFVALPNPPAINNQQAGDELIFEDKDLTAGERYVYKVEALGDDSFTTNGQTLGFIFYNGQISGKVTTNHQDAVQDVEITAALKNGGVPGHALMFDANTPAIEVDNIEALRNQPRFTMEFWYKGAGNNTVFAMGNSKIQLTSNKIIVTNADGNAYLEGNLKTRDNQWHHYAFTFAPVLDEEQKPIGAEGKLYQDGEELATTPTPYQAPPGGVNRFLIGAQNNAAYQLDEFKAWKVAKSAKQIKQTYRHVLSGEEDNLLLYYRFDEGDGKEVYNYALTNRNEYIGKSQSKGQDLHWSASQYAGLYYGILTSTSGAYVLRGLNYGTSSTGKTFNVVPQKPNHEFRAPVIEVLLQRGQHTNKSEIDFTDISQFTISGRVVYKEGEEVYPVPQGQQITLNNGTTTILAPGDKAKSDAAGLFTTSASPELLTIAVNSVATKRSNLVNQSLRFDGKTAYAQSEGTISHQGNATWSFWVKPASATETFEGDIKADDATQETPSLPIVQTVFQLGNIQLDLENSETLVLKKEGTDLVRSTQTIGNQAMTFCAISYEAATQKFTIYVGETPDVSNAVSGVDMTGHFTLGAAWVNNDMATPFRGHVDHIEFRTRTFAHNEFKQIKEGNFIANDAQHLRLSYPIVTSGGNRELSLTAQAKHQGLKLVEALRDNKIVAINQGTYKYSYLASNPRYNPRGKAAYELNLTGVTTGLDFENTTRYGFVGNLIVPCDNHIGDLKGRIFRTDIQGYEKSFDASHFNGNVFAIENLLPGKYRVEIFRENAGADAEPLLRSPVVDITQGWASYDFEYHNPLMVSYKIYAVEVKANVDEGKPEVGGVRGQEIQPLCTGKYSLKAYTNYELELTVSEEFQNGKCNVAGVDYTVSGSLGTPATGHENGKTNENGKASIRFMSAGPSFDAANYLEQFQISARTKNRDTEDFLKSFITGSQMLSNDFTLTEPQVMYVLHDPPGDGSFAKIEEGTTISFTSQYTTDIGVETSTAFTAGSDVVTTTGGGFGVFILNRFFAAKGGTGISIDASNLNTIDNSTLWTLTLNESYSTAAGGKVVGPDADLLIGVTRVITRGKSRELIVGGCSAEIRENPNATALSYKSSFATKVEDVKETTIPGLESLIEELSAKSNLTTKESALLDSARSSKVAWKNILKKNEEKIAKADTYEKLRHGYNAGANRLDYEKGDFVFSGGGSSYTVTLDWSKEYSTTNSHAFNGKIGTPFTNSTSIVGIKLDVKTQVSAVWNNKFSFKNTENKKTGISFTLTDDDQGDQFHVFMRRDPDYDTPIFKTSAGRSSCPYERGTQPREGVRVEVLDGATKVTPAGTKAVYKVRLTNTQIADDNRGKSYVLDVSANTTNAAKISINGNASGIPASFFLMPGASDTTTVSIQQNDSGDTSYENIALRFYSSCEFTAGTTKYTANELYERNKDGTVKKDANGNPVSVVKVFDQVLLNTYFREPCVSKFEINQPTTNWVVNNTSNNRLRLRFKPETAKDDFKKVEVEYATEGNNKAQLLTTLDVDELTKDSEEYYTVSLDVSSLVDGKYSLRLVPVCGEAGTNRNNVSEWIEGTIQRNAPVIASVTPADNGIIGSDGVISATYTDKISNDGVNSLNINVMGVLANSNYEATAARFTEATDQIQIPDNDVLDMDSCTVEFWVKPLLPSTTVPIIEKGNNFQISLMPDGTVNAQRVRSDQPLAPNQWSHVAVTYSKSNKAIRIYINGRLAGERDLKLVSEPFGTNDQPVTIAKAVNGQGFKGSLDEIRIWSKARTSNQIINNYRKMLLGNEDKLVGYYRLDNNALTVNGTQEGIRDFTGNASGTTVQGVTWVTKQEAAPLQVEAVPQSIPVTIHRSNENQILITPDLADSDLEGAYLTVNIANNKIKDLLGNEIKGEKWSFRYEKNHIAWNQRSIDLQQVWQQEKNFALTLMNSGATEVTYELTDLPKWIKPSDKTTNQTYTLNSGQNESIDFVLQPWLNAGEHTGTIKAKVFDRSGRLLGTELVIVNVNVSCAAPLYTLNAAQYQYAMFLNASLHINGQRSIDERDKVTAFVMGSNGQAEVRGTGQVRRSGDRYKVSMLIHSNQETGEALQFRVWDASECREYGSIIEQYTFAKSTSLNNQTLTVGNTLVRKFNVVAGFQYVTFNATNQGRNYLSIDQVKGLPTGAKVYTQNGQEATYDGQSWSGNLTQLLPTQAYQVESPVAAQVELQGHVVALSTVIQINPGINWIGYLSDQTFPIGQALSGLNISDNTELRLVGQGGFSIYDSQTNQWSGTLEYLAPNMGYQLIALGNGTLNYATSLGANASAHQLSNRASQNRKNKPMYEVRTEARAMGMQVNALKYRYAAHVMGVVTQDGQHLDAADYIVTAHTNTGEVRGVAVPQMVNGKLMYFLTVHTNDKQAAYEVRLTHRETKTVQKLETPISYVDQVQGSLQAPYEFRMKRVDTQVKEAKAALFSGYKLYQNQPNPFHDVTSISYELPQADEVHLTVYNAQGQVVAVLAKGLKAVGKHTVQWQRNGLPSGVYFYALTTKAGKPMTKRLVIH
ncbi:hypothetical protein M23134_00406 [Microscilla marina ATCC 23134]|uniref:LamG-like jellyroll fold domain-containing protein n=2 Tax=Microscilla marina TaxID=1027 RepID=A1ZIY6_MICM2|nr:hypothetical protein M23134_00406 [Microscilla marina ATCC 23134]